MDYHRRKNDREIQELVKKLDHLFQEEKSHWKIEKKIPIVLLFGIIIQVSSIIWWASKIEERISSLERIIYSIVLKNNTTFNMKTINKRGP